MLHKNKGFSLVEILITIGLLSIISFAIMTTITNSMKSQKGVQAKDQQRDFTSEIRNILNNKAACFNSFGGTNPQSPPAFTAIKDAANTSAYTIGSQDKSSMLKITQIKISDWSNDAGNPLQGNAVLRIGLSKIGDTQSVTEIRPDSISLKIKINGSGNIIECFSIGMSSDGFWQATPSNLSDIYYSGGRVGIGTQAPNGTLEVAGGIRSAKGLPSNVNNSTQGFTFEQDGDSGLFSVGGNSHTGSDLALLTDGQDRVHVSVIGNVGIGTATPQDKLHVAGGRIRGQLNCRKAYGPTALNGSTAQCGANEYVISGGGTCSNGTVAYLHQSEPLDDLSGWVADCFLANGLADTLVTAYAICCLR